MTECKIELEGDGTFLPGEKVRGRLSGGTLSGELRLFWRTTGRGTAEIEVVDHQAVSAAGFLELKLPSAPFSTAGTLVSIEWWLECVDESGSTLSSHELVVSPTHAVIELGRVDQPESEKSIFSGKAWN